jgi:co-chaperonin GroES (HSP10)
MATLLERANAKITVPPDSYDSTLEGLERLVPLITAKPGIVALVPDMPIERMGSLYIPTSVADHITADIGTVVSSGDDDLVPGDRVLFFPYSGTWFTPFRVGRLKIHEMRFYGLISPSVDEEMAVKEDTSTPIPAKWRTGGEILPRKDWVLIKRDPLRTNQGEFSLELPDSQKYRNWKATVMAVGPDASEKVGDRVMYYGPSIVINLDIVGNDAKDYALIRSENLLCALKD